jgi:Putative DnaT-like ssDNA binding protein
VKPYHKLPTRARGPLRAASVNATPGSATANSYATVAEANAYHEAHVDGAVWDDLDPDVKVRALIQATRTLDANMDWRGTAATVTQALGWPRLWAYTKNGYIIDSTVIPVELKYATAELARLLATGSGGGGGAAQTLKSLKAGPIDVVFKEDAEIPAAVPSPVAQMILHLAERGTTSGVSWAEVIRS